MENRQNFFSHSAQNYPVISENGYAETLQKQVVPFLDSLRRFLTFDRGNGQKLYCEYFLQEIDAQKGTVFISHGFTESCDKYHEVIWYLLREGYHVVMPEHRGHGRSRRPDETDVAHTPTHVDHFQDYVDDMETAVREILQAKMPAPYYLFAHSMGGAIAAAYLEQHPGVFQKAVFSAPMFEINLHGISKPTAKLIGIWNCATGKKKAFTIGQNPFSFTPDFPNYPCNCETRYLYYYNRQLSHPEYQSAGSSNRWALEGLRACDRLLRPANCTKIDIPVLLFQADQDDFVCPGGQDRFIRQVPNGTLIFVPDSKHEIYMCRDEIVEKYWGIIFDFYEKQ